MFFPRYFCTSDIEAEYDPEDILSISKFCFCLQVRRECLPEQIRKHIGGFRAGSLLKLNEDNNSPIPNTLKAQTLEPHSKDIITVNVGDVSSNEEELSDHESGEGEEQKDPKDEIFDGPSKDSKEHQSIEIHSNTSYRQTRYGRTIKPSTSKSIHSDCKGEIILELNSDNECDEMETDVNETNTKELNGATETTTGSRNKFGTGKLLCKYCDRRYHHLKARNKHMISEHLDRCQKDGHVFKCELCGTNFVSAIGKSKHMKRVHGQKEESSRDNAGHEKELLNHCPFEDGGKSVLHFGNIKDLKAHIKEQHPDKDKACIGCGLNCDTKENLIEHIQVHETGSVEARNLYSCEQCHQKFLSEYVMMTHKRSVHSLCETLSCEVCGKEFKNSKFLANHIKRHSNGELVNCDENDEEFCCELLIPEKGDVPCGKTFKLKCNLERHIKTSHMQIKQHQCNDCGKKFVDSTRLKEHRWIHTDHRPIKCSLCEKGFRHQNHLRHHMAKVHGKDKDFSCHVCPKKFVYNYQLKTHMLTHSQSKNRLRKDDPQNAELVAGKETALIINMDSGLVEQEADADPYVQTLYQCSLCQQVFETYKALRIHCTQHSQRDFGATNTKDVKSNSDVNRPIDITLVSDNALENQLSFNSENDNEKQPQFVLEIDSEHSNNKSMNSSSRGVNLPLQSLEGTIIKEQDGQQYYVVYDVPASQPIIRFEK